MGSHVVHIEIDNDNVYRAFKQWKKDGKFPTLKLAFYNFSEIRERSGVYYMQIKKEKRGKTRGRTPKYMPTASAINSLHDKSL